MRFILVHKTVTYLMALTSTVSVIASGEVPPWMAVLFLLAAAGSWFWEPPRIQFQRFDLAWNIVTMLVLGLAGFQAMGSDALLSAGVGFILFLIVNKLFNRKTSKDYLQLYVLSFMLLIAGTAVDVDITYGIQFVLYIVFGTWTLILFHLKREMEDNFLLKYGDSLQGRPVQVERVLNSRKLIGGRFLVATSAISLLVFVGSTLVFVFFPRIGFGLFFKKQRPGVLMTGFSDRVELGQFGTIKDDPTVVMRVEFPDLPPGQYSAGYWRGVSFDRYDGRRWTKSRTHRRRLLRDADDRYLVSGQPWPAQTTRQAIYLEPMETHVLFGMTRLHGVELPDIGAAAALPDQQRSVFRDAEWDVLYSQNDELAFRYFAYSGPDDPDPTLWNMPLADYRGELALAREGARYLQLPDGLDPAVGQLAQRVIGDAATVGQAVERVENHLRSNYQYSLTLEPGSDRPPLEDFLFEQKKGHCEYFATALTILLRTQGIGTRNVNGFLGGTWNEYGNYLSVSQGEAHSWAEVWLPGRNWATRDATPSGPSHAAESSVLTALAQYADAMRLRWYKYVIEYDLGRQVWLFESVRSGVGDLFGGLFEGEKPGDAQGAGGSTSRPGAPAMWGVVAALALGGGVFFVIRRRRPGGASGVAGARRQASDTVAELYLQMVRQYTTWGIARPPAATAREYLALLRRREAPGLSFAERVVELYEGSRFGGDPPDAGLLQSLRAELKRLRPAPPAVRP